MTDLKRLPVLLLDCQATGCDPDRDSLLEIGWARFQARDPEPPAVSSRLVRPTPEARLPRRVERVTGIDQTLWNQGRDIAEIWTELAATLGQLPERNGRACPVVIHFARFEKPFLRRLESGGEARAAPPLRIICTHEICKRLLPDLPRRGLRAVAGYFGHSVPEPRRCAHHVTATAAIWRSLVEALEKRGIDTLTGLLVWLDETHGSPRCGRVYPMGRRRRLSLPAAPGVYRIRRVNGDILYVGKANCLKRRVNSHFQKRSSLPERALEMLAQAQDLDFTVTDSALEAALLESDEIKSLSPPYNVLLRERNRELTFCDPEFRTFAPTPPEGAGLGPFPHSAPPQTLGALAAWLGGAPDIGPIERWACFRHPSEPPSEEELVGGLALFAETHRLKAGEGVRRLLGIGDALWLQRLQEQRAMTEEPEEPEQAGTEETRLPEEPFAWTPQRVAGALARSLLLAARSVRRARWLCLLSESAVCWETGAGRRKRLRMLRIEGGGVIDRGYLAGDSAPPAPQSRSRDRRARQLSIDLQSYDRLSVLTTELKRLASAGRSPQVRFRRVLLQGRALANSLQWL